MIKSIFYKHNIEYTRISKPKARRHYVNGDNIIIVPCNCDPFGAWVGGLEIVPDNCTNTADEFNRIVNHYEYYNCCNELGRYASFYISSDNLEEV